MQRSFKSQPDRTMAEKMSAVASRQRDKVVNVAMKRKEEFLGARVPKELRDRVITKANELNIPVSILIRQILEEAFSNKGMDVVKSVVANNVTDGLAPNPSYALKYPDVIGWEKISLNKMMTCATCSHALLAGIGVYYGVGGNAGSQVILCQTCAHAI